MNRINGFKMVAMLLVVSLLIVTVSPMPTKAAATTKSYVVLITNKESVCIREEPHNKGEVVETVPYGTLLHADVALPIVKNDKGNTWYKLVYNGRTAYVYSGYVVNAGITVDELPGESHVCSIPVSIEIANAYTRNDSKTHNRTISAVNVCAVCGIEFEYCYTVVQEKHDYKSGKNGACICGAVKGALVKTSEIAKTVIYIMWPTFAVNEFLIKGVVNDISDPEFAEKFSKQFVEGSVTDPSNITLTESLTELGLSFIGADAPLDVRDIVQDVTHFDELVEEKGVLGAGATLLVDAAAIVPVIGSVKHADNIVDGMKAAKKADAAADATKDLKVIKKVTEAKDTAKVAKQTEKVSSGATAMAEVKLGAVAAVKDASEAIKQTETISVGASLALDGLKKTNTIIKRIIPGTEGIVTGGDSTKLGKNMMKKMGLSSSTKWKGYQAHHLIPKGVANHPVLKKMGMDLDDASNGIFLRTASNGEISIGSRHTGYHSVYNEFVRTKLDEIDIGQSSYELQKQVAGLQAKLRKLQENGVNLYNSTGKESATLDMMQRAFDRLN